MGLLEQNGRHGLRDGEALGFVSGFKTLDDLPEDLTGKKVLVRVDLNIPMEGARVTDDTRLRAMLPTVLELSDRGAIVELDHRGQRAARREPGAHLVDDRDHEDRSGGAEAARPGNGTQ